MSLYDVDRPDLKDDTFTPSIPDWYNEYDNIFDAIRKRDRLLHHPYDSYDCVTGFINQAVEDPDVLAIKICLYRTGPDSPIPNRNGLRLDVLQALKDIHVPVIRWPGGCYADEYHWRNGIGPTAERPVTLNMSWGGIEETNAFGTHEFFELVEAIGADAYIAGNLGTGSAREIAEWLEYMTSDSRSALAERRRANGRDAPWRVAFFGVGNESWGCGGNMRPEYYADLYRQTAEFLKVRGERPKRIASEFFSTVMAREIFYRPICRKSCGNRVWNDGRSAPQTICSTCKKSSGRFPKRLLFTSFATDAMSRCPMHGRAGRVTCRGIEARNCW